MAAQGALLGEIGLFAGNSPSPAVHQPGKGSDLGQNTGWRPCARAGPGPLARKVAPGLVYALDVQTKMIAKAKMRLEPEGLANVRFAVGDAECLPLNPGAVDKVFANQVLEEVADLNSALSEIKRVLRPKGTLAIIQYWFDFTPTMRDALKAIAAAHGLILQEESSTRLSWKAIYERD